MNDQLVEIAARQKALIESGVTSLEHIGSLKARDADVIEGEFSDV